MVVIENKAVKEIKKMIMRHNLNLTNLSLYIAVHPIRISEILNHKRSITADTDLRLCKFFKLKDGHFLKLQMEYNLDLTKEKIIDKLVHIKNVDEVLRQ